MLGIFKNYLTNALLKYHKGGNISTLILDDKTKDMITNVLTMTELINHSIHFVNMINDKRSDNKFNKIYLISPENIELLLEDFKEQEPLYKNITKVSLYTTSRINDYYFNKLKENKLLVNRLENLIELNCDFTIKNDNLIDVSNNMTDKLKFIFEIIKSSASNFIPIIRYQNISQNNKCKDIAKSLNNYFEKQEKSNSKYIKCKKIIILDRSIDLVTPILNKIEYQSCMDNNEINYDENNMIITKDYFWKNNKYNNIFDVIKQINNMIDELKKFKEQEMKNIIKDIDKSKQIINLIKTHTELSKQCMEKISKINTLELEYEIASNHTIINNKLEYITNYEIVEKLYKFMIDSKNSEEEKERIFTIFIISQKEIKNYSQYVKLKEIIDKYTNIISFLERNYNIKLKLPANTISDYFNFEKKETTKIIASKNKYDKNIKFSHYVPNIEFLMIKLINNELSLEDFPYETNKSYYDSYNIDMIIIIIGGITNYEVGEVVKLCDKKNIKVLFITDKIIKKTNIYYK